MTDLSSLQSATRLPRDYRDRASGALVRVRHRLPFGFGATMKSLLSQGISGAGAVFQTWNSLSTSMYGPGETEGPVDPYLQESWIAAAWNLRIATVALPKLRLWDRDPDDEDAQEIADGPVYELLQRVGPLWDGPSLRQADTYGMLTSGDSIWLMFDRRGQPVSTIGSGAQSFFDLPASIYPIAGQFAEVEEYDLDTDEILRWRINRPRRMRRGSTSTSSIEYWPAAATLLLREKPDPRRGREGRGIGQLAQLYGPMVEAFFARRYTRVMLQNLGDPGGIVEIDQWLTEDERDLLTLEAEERLANPNTSGSPLLLEGGAKYRQGRLTPRDMAWSELLKSDREQMAAVTNTPSALLGLEVANYATFEGTYQQYLDLNAIPFLETYARLLNTRFFPRLTDREYQGIRCRFDVEILRTAEAHRSDASTAKAWTDVGMPLREALRQARIKADPIPGDDVSLVPATMVAREAAILSSRAAAVRAAIAAGMDPAEAWRRAGIEDAKLVELDPEEDPEDEGDDEGDGEDEPNDDRPPSDGPEDDDEEPQAVERRARTAPPPHTTSPSVTPTPGAPATLRGPPSVARDLLDTEGGRVVAWLMIDGPLEKYRTSLLAKLHKRYRAMRKEQLAAIEAYAKTGQLPTKGAADAAVYADPLPIVARADLDDWRRARLGDAAEPGERRVSANVSTCPCTGRQQWAPATPRAEEWRRRHPRYAGIPSERLDDLALLRGELTEAEIDQLIIVQAEKWSAAIAADIHPLTMSAFNEGWRRALEEAGISVLTTPSPNVLAFFRDKAFLVAEGTTSTLAQRLRSVFVQTLAEHGGGVGTMRTQVLNALKELRASTTAAFNSHSARALAIARTELGQSWSMSRYDAAVKAYEKGAITHVVWLTSGRGPEPLGTVRLAHYRMEGERVVPGQNFSAGLKYPREPGAPADLVVNCVCNLGMVTAGEDDEGDDGDEE